MAIIKVLLKKNVVTKIIGAILYIGLVLASLYTVLVNAAFMGVV